MQPSFAAEKQTCSGEWRLSEVLLDQRTISDFGVNHDAPKPTRSKHRSTGERGGKLCGPRMRFPSTFQLYLRSARVKLATGWGVFCHLPRMVPLLHESKSACRRVSDVCLRHCEVAAHEEFHSRREGLDEDRVQSLLNIRRETEDRSGVYT